MGSLIIVLPIVSVLVGLYFITLGLWELRKGVNRKQYIKYMFTGLFLLVVLTPMIWLFGSSSLMKMG
ncbi:putative membrane protein [Bacillus tianshenii]|uniref:Membrane protein n=1 Tax=Sutcliffiella tianshenii TaxID=1463404 RepID=A0ABS2P306_9BACI|nr:putative membrane protein [Bacillus tianshenii]